MSKIRVIIIGIVVIIISVVGLIIYHTRVGKAFFTSGSISVASPVTSFKSGISGSTVKPITPKEQPEGKNTVEWVDATAKGRVVWADTHKGIKGASVQIVGEHFTRVFTDKDGYYLLNFRGIIGSTYKIAVVLPKDITKDDPYIIDPFYIPGYPEIKVSHAGEEISAPDIKIQKGGIIRGRVLRADGKPFKEEEIERVCVEGRLSGKGSRAYLSCTSGMIHAHLDKDGYYVLKGIARISGLDIKACAFGYMCQEVRDVKMEAGKGKVMNIDITIPTNDPTGIEGIITDKQTGKPISGATVMMLAPNNPNGVAVVLTERNGKYQISGVRPGNYGLLVFHANYTAVEKTEPIQIKREERKTISLSLSPTYRQIPEKVKDPTAQLDQSCTSFSSTIIPAFNQAMSTFEGCMNSVYWEDLDSRGIINISCGGCKYATSAAETDSVGSNHITICLDNSGNLKSSNLAPAIFHEAVHVAGYDSGQAYILAEQCYKEKGYSWQPVFSLSVPEYGLLSFRY